MAGRQDTVKVSIGKTAELFGVATRDTEMKSESSKDELHQQETYFKVRQLIADHDILLRAMGAEGVDYRYPSGRRDYLDRLSTVLLDDDAEALGRLMIDQVVHYVWALAEREVDSGDNTPTH